MLRSLCWCGSERHPFCTVTKKSIGHLVEDEISSRQEHRWAGEVMNLAGQRAFQVGQACGESLIC